MIFINGLPRDAGASDCKDSSRLAGMMAIVKHPQAPELVRYMEDGKPVRFPGLDPKDFSRDQLVPYVAGLKQQGRSDIVYSITFLDCVDNKAPNGDFLSSSVINHLLLCSGQKGFFSGYFGLLIDIIWAALISPSDEQNQLIAMCNEAGPRWLKLYRFLNRKYKQSLQAYWCGWRGEPELCQMIINLVEAA